MPKRPITTAGGEPAGVLAGSAGGAAASRDYAAFLSYSESAESALARRLAWHLEHFERPVVPRRARNVYLAPVDQPPSSDLKRSLELALEASHWLVLLASPASARSSWVTWEVEWWLDHKGPDHLLVALAVGTLPWGRQGRAAEGLESALSLDVVEHLGREPLWTDLTAYHSGKANLRDATYHDAVAGIVAAISGRPKADLIREQRRRRSRWNWLWRAIAVALALLALVALLQSREARRQQRIATARQLMAEADSVRTSDPLTALRLGIAAHAVDPGDATRLNLLATMTTSRLAGQLGRGDVSGEIRFLPGRPIMLASATGGLLLTDLSDPAHPTVTALPESASRGFGGAIAVSPDGRRVAAVVEPSTDVVRVEVWDVSDAAHPRKWPRSVPTKRARDAELAFSTRTGRLAVVDDQGIEAWSLGGDHPRQVAALAHGLRRPLSAPSFSSDDGALRLVSNGRLHSWDAVGDRYTRRDESGPGPEALLGTVVGVRGDFVVTADDGAVSVWRASPESDPVQVKGPVKVDQVYGFSSFALSDDAGVLAVARSDNRVSVIDKRPLPPIEVEHRPAGWSQYLTGLALSGDGRLLATTDPTGRVVFWDVTRGLTLPTAQRDVAATTALGGLTASPAGAAFAATGTGIQGWKVGADGTFESTPYLSVDGAKGPLAASAANGLLAGVVGDRPAVWNIRGQLPALIAAPETFAFAPVFAQTFSPNGRFLAVGGYSGVAVFDLTDPARPRRTDADPHSCGVACFALEFSPDGSVLAAGTRSQQVLLRRVSESGRMTQLGEPLTGAGTSLSSVRFSPRGDLLLGVDQAGNVLVWRVRHQAQPTFLAQLLPSNGARRSASFSSDGTLLAVTDGAGVELYGVTSPGRLVRIGRLEDSGTVDSVAFGAGRALVSSVGHQLTGWNLDQVARRLQDADRTACGIAKRGLTRDEWESRISGLGYRQTCANGNVAGSP